MNPMASLFYSIFTYLSLAVLGLHCCVQAFTNCGEWRPLPSCVHRLLVAAASLVPELGL